LDAIEKRTPEEHIKGAKALPEVDQKEDVLFSNKRMARRDGKQMAAINKASKAAKPAAMAMQKEIEDSAAAHAANEAAAEPKRKALKAQLMNVAQAADESAKAHAAHAEQIEVDKSRADRAYASLQNERESMEDYTVTDNVHHPDAPVELLQITEEQDGDTLDSMKKALEETKTESAKEVAQAQNNAMLAINKVKAQVEMLKSKQKQELEAAQKKEVQAVRHVAGKAMLAVNAAKLAGALNGADSDEGASGHTDAKKAALLTKMAADRKNAETSAMAWKDDAHKLSSMVSARVAHAKAVVRDAEKNRSHADANVKLATQVTETFKKLPATVSAPAKY